MLSRRFRTFAAPLAAIAAFLLVGSRAEAALELVVTTGSTTDVFYATSSTSLSTTTFTIGGYTGQVDTTITNFPGGNPSFISTTLNMTGTSGSPDLVATVQVVQNVSSLDPSAGGSALSPSNAALVQASPLLSWTSPSGSPVIVTANTSTSSQLTASSGSAVTTSLYNGSGVVASGSLSLTALPSPSVLNSTSASNAGTFTFGQSIDITGGSGSFNVTGTSTISGPEPSTMALAGLGALGLIGYGLRRRKAMGA
jgi:hypothetical protein